MTHSSPLQTPLMGLIFLLSSLCAFSQTPVTIEVSRQEFTTLVRSSVIDANDNVYHAGLFKGALSIDNDTIMYGRGNNDLFILKMDSTEAPLWSLNIGSEQNEASNLFMLLQDNSLFVGFSVLHNFFIGDMEVNGITPGEQTSILAKLDTNGNVLWVRKTNGRMAKLHPGQNKIVVECNVPNNLPAVLFESQLVFTSNGVANQLLMTIDEDGNYLNSINIYQNTENVQNLNLSSLSDTSGRRYYFLITTSQNNSNPGNNRFFVGDTSVLLPTDFRNTLLIKTDSAFNLLGSKVLHPVGNINLFNTINNSNFRLSDKNNKLNLLPTMGMYEADGYSVTFTNSNQLISIDTSLLTISIKKINQNENAPVASQQSVQVVEEHENGYTIIGTVIGKNNSPISDQVPTQNVEVNITEHFKQTININGPSQSYILRTNLNFEPEAFTWIGSSSVYEQANPAINDIQIKNNHLYFLNLLDNIWAPWKVTKSLVLKKGAFVGNANGADYAEHVGFFSDKTSYIIGTANGSNAFDTSNAGISNGNNRRDVFISIFNNDGTIKKYHRIFSSSSVSSITRVRMANDTLYAMVIFNSSINQPGSNFFKIDTITTLFPGLGHRALFKVDKSGGIQYMNLQNSPIGVITDFDIYENGDIAALTFATTTSLNLNGQIFPSSSGFYVAKLHPTGFVKEAIKIGTSSTLSIISPLKINLEKNQDYIGLMLNTTFRNNLPELQLIHYRNGNQVSVKNITNPNPELAILKNYVLFYRLSMTNNLDVSILGPVGQSSNQSFISQNKSNLLYVNIANNGDSLKFNEKLINTANPNLSSYIFVIDSNLQYKKHLSFIGTPNSLFSPFRMSSIRTFNNHFYFSGYQWSALTMGALTIPYVGNGDGLTLKVDTGLNVLQFFKVSSPYSELTTDFAIHTDSTFMVGYRSQTTPSISIGVNSMLVQNSTTQSVKPGDFAEVGYVKLAPASNLPNDFVISVKNGDWNEPSTWQTGKVPTNADKVFIKHKVQINASATCFTLFVDPGADLQIASGNQIIITGFQQQ